MKAYILDIGQLHKEEVFADGLAMLGKVRKEKIARLRNENAKKSSLGAGLLLQYTFARLGKEHLLEEIAFTEKGKPYLPNEEFYFNLSHSGEKVLCVTHDKSIGCDIEKIRDTIPKHLGKIFSESELKQFKTLSEEDKIQYFFQLWTIKESIGKYYGSGLAFPFAKVTVMHENAVLPSVIYEDNTVYLHSEQYDDYMLGICSKSDDFCKNMKNLQISDIIY